MPHRAPISVYLLDEEPDLGQLLPADRMADARRLLVARCHTARTGPWDDPRLRRRPPAHLGLLLLDGLVGHEVVLADHVSTHLFGPGDVIRPWQAADPGQLLRAEHRWTVLATARMAVLDARMGALIAHFPEVNAMLVCRLSEQMHRMATAQAIGHLTGVDRRLLALFWHLAERWGRVAPSGVAVPLAISHGVLAALIGARRPTVSTALGKLAARGELCRQPDGSWLLTGTPVGEPTPSAARVVRRRLRLASELPRELGAADGAAASAAG